jgi:hypothetical protein
MLKLWRGNARWRHTAVHPTPSVRHSGLATLTATAGFRPAQGCVLRMGEGHATRSALSAGVGLAPPPSDW